MKPAKTLCFPVIAAMCLTGAALPAQPRDHAHFTRSELRRLIRNAHTDEQYQTLATCFRALETHFRRKAADQDQEYQRLRFRTLPAKYPTPADSAKGLRDYYRYRAAQADVMAAKFEARITVPRRPQ